MSSADIVTCLCNSCNALLCVSTNAWTEITSSYATYDVPQFFSHPGLELSGPLRPGSKDSELEGCTVQPLNCAKCKDPVGVKCVNVVAEKEKHRHRCFLKLSKLRMKNLEGSPTEPAIKTREGVRLDSKTSSYPKKQSRALAETNGQNGVHIRSNSQEPEVQELQTQSDVIQRVQQQEGDIVVILQNLKALQQEMRDFQDEMGVMRTDADHIRAQQEEDQSRMQTEELEMLTESVSKVSSKLGEVESLKLEVKMMQSRIKRLEDEKRLPQRVMGPPLTPRSATNGSRSVPSFDSTFNKRLSSSNLKPSLGINGRDFENSINRSRAASVQIDYDRTIAISTGLKSSQAASVQGDDTRSAPTRSDMPPPPIPIRNSSQNPTKLRSASETPRTRQTQNNLNNAISVLNESATEFPTEVEDSDDEYKEGDPSPDEDEDDGTYRTRHSRQSLPSTFNKEVDPEGTPDNPRKRRRTTASVSLNRDSPSPQPGDPSYKSVWATSSGERQKGTIWTPRVHERNEHGLIIKPNGSIDKRSLRFLGKAKGRRRPPRKEETRDEEGYLLLPDGTRNMRSQGIIDGLKNSRDRSLSEVPN